MCSPRGKTTRTEIMRRMLDHPAYAHGNATAALNADLADRVHAFDLAGQGPLWEQCDRGHGRLTETGMALRLRCEALGARLLVIDPLGSGYADSEISRGAVRAFIGGWDAWAREADCTVFIVGHPPKGMRVTMAAIREALTGARRALVPVPGTDGRHAGPRNPGCRQGELCAAAQRYRLENWVWWKTLPWSEHRRARLRADREDHIIELLEAEQPRSQRDILKKLGGKGRPHVAPWSAW